MPLGKEALVKRIEEIRPRVGYDGSLAAAYSATMSVIRVVYGERSPQESLLSQIGERVLGKMDRHTSHTLLAPQIEGILDTMREELEAGLLGSQTLRVSGEVLGDLLGLAKVAAGDGGKDVSAVLAAAGFEDT